jgi:hypothetical protein
VESPLGTQGAVDLGARGVEATKEALVRVGALCGGCGRPTYSRWNQPTWDERDHAFPVWPGPGEVFEFLLISPPRSDAPPPPQFGQLPELRIDAARRYACARPDCDTRHLLLENSTAVRVQPAWYFHMAEPNDATDPMPTRPDAG